MERSANLPGEGIDSLPAVLAGLESWRVRPKVGVGEIGRRDGAASLPRRWLLRATEKRPCLVGQGRGGRRRRVGTL
jgi:hypothetical protein